MINAFDYSPKIIKGLTMDAVKFSKNFLHADVLCLKHYHDYTLAGIGNHLFVYENTNLVLTEPIFKEERIHSIYVQNNLILIKGGRQLSLVKFDTSKCIILSHIQSKDWIQDVILFENRLAGLVTAHNAFEFWNLESKQLVSASSCEESCILYSCKITGSSRENVTVFAGTVFGDVLIWAPLIENNSVLQQLKAHNGAVFSIEVKLDDNLLATTSDDRSFKLWSIISNQSLASSKNWKHLQINLTHTLFGHTARVWKSLILPQFYLTAGEDSQLIVWGKDGRMIKTLLLHQESGIRAVDYSQERDVITTGGEDGGINTFSLNHLLSESEARVLVDLGQSISTKVAFVCGGLIYTLNGACVMLTGDGEKILYENEKFSSYCVLDVSPGGGCIVLGSITGQVVVIEVEKRRVIVDEQAMQGRVYSVHWLENFILTCGPDGELILWEFSSGGLRNVNKMLLPNCRERWTTCGCIYNGELVVGDRMGGIHLYDLHTSENPLKTFRKIHSYLGVTDLKALRSVCLSVGRDGTVKEYTEGLNLSTTYKLPMDWPWKIVNYEDDILILGFHSVSFIVWSMKWREIIASHECGGSHRSCHYKLHKNKLSFLYVKEKKISVVVLPLDEITRMRNGSHGREINCLEIVGKDSPVIITGSEDTTLRISAIGGSDIRQMQVLKTHISSIRALSMLKIDSERAILVSVGGKGQMVVWNLDLKNYRCQELVNHRLKKEDSNWKTPSLYTDPETRLMCADISQSGKEFLIAVGCSDCQVRIFSFDEELHTLCSIPYSHCILKIGVFNVSSMRLLVTMATDGKAVFWDLTDRANVNQLGSFSLHQSGINSFQLVEVGCGEFILATGGDDNLVSVAVIKVDGENVTLRRIWENSTAHSCQVTGIKILQNLLVTASIDQRITVWKWSWLNGEFTAQFMNQCMTAVPDVQGMDAKWQSTSSVLITVHGKGLETFEIDVEPSEILNLNI